MPPIDPANPVVKLVSAGTRAEFEHRPDAARACYEQAWQAHTDDYEACIAAHYLARCQPTPQQALRWDLEALQRAQAAPAESVREFMPSLYLSERLKTIQKWISRANLWNDQIPTSLPD